MRKNTTTPVVDFATPELQLEDLAGLDESGNLREGPVFLQDLGLHLTISLRDGYTAATRAAVLLIVAAWIARHPILATVEIFEGEELYDDAGAPSRFIGVRGGVAPLPHERDLMGRLSGELIAALTGVGVAVQPCRRELETASGADAVAAGYPDGAGWFGRPEPIGPLIPALDVWGEGAAE